MQSIVAADIEDDSQYNCRSRRSILNLTPIAGCLDHNIATAAIDSDRNIIGSSRSTVGCFDHNIAEIGRTIESTPKTCHPSCTLDKTSLLLGRTTAKVDWLACGQHRRDSSPEC